MELHELSTKFSSVLHALPVAAYLVDANGTVHMWNKAAEDLLGWTEQELIMNALPHAIAGGSTEVWNVFEASFRGRSLKNYRCSCARIDGAVVPVSISSGPIKSSGYPAVLGVITDVSDNLRLEEQLLQSQKMEAIGRLAGGIAHDFNNLLTAIAGYSKMLLEELDPGMHARHYAEQVLKSADHASSLTKQLLAFSRRQIMQPRVITLNGVVADIAKLLKRLIGADIELHTCLSPDPGSVKADPSQIEQVIMNLVVNSRDAMPDGGRITIETGNVVLDEAYGRTHVGVAAGPYVMLAISDTGHGISEEVKAHLFEPFFTTKDRGKGTGLGLSTVYGIVRQSGGVIWVYSEVGQGTTFKIFFPRTDEPWQRTERGRPSVEEGIATGEETILLAEDEAVVRQWVAEALTKQGYDVIAASSPAEAIELAQRYDKPIHLLLTDVVMPGMSGRELASRIRAVRSDIRVLYMSGYTENAVVHHGILDPNVVLLQKPFGEEMLSRKIRDVLEHS